MITDAKDIRFRCSSLWHIMIEGNKITEKQLALIGELQAKEKITDKQSITLKELIYKRDNPELSEGCKTHLVDLYVSAKYGRREEIRGKFLDKGHEREEDSVTLLSRLSKIFYLKNSERLTDDDITGEPDLFLGTDIRNAEAITDIKTSWSAFTFFRAQKEKLNPIYFWQGVAYMMLTGAKSHTVAYCLVNGTHDAIEQEKRILSYQKGMMGIDGIESPAMIEKMKQIEINHIFDKAAFEKEYPFYEWANKGEWIWDIPMKERLFTIQFERNEDDIQRVRDRVKMCREWMNQHLFKIA